MSNLNGVSQVVVFGDSLSDPGNSFALTFGIIPPEPPYFSGRFSNGLVATDYLARDLGLTVDPYFDDGVGNNFAVGGAKTGTGNSNNDDIAPILPGVELPGVAEQIDLFEQSLGSETADPEGLYVLWAGPNDFLDYLGGSDLSDPAVLIESGIENIANGVTRLSDLGAEHLVVPNMPSLGRLPFSAEFSDEATAVTVAFNGGVALALDNLRLNSESNEAEIIEVDLFALNEAIAANPEAFGFSNITDAFLLSGMPLPTDPTARTGYFFWDIFHPTTEAHVIFAGTISRTISGDIPQPTFNDILGTDETDYLFGSEAADNVDGFGGDDLIFGGQGSDRLEGWAGNDWLFGNRGDDILSGGDDRDSVFGGNGDDLLFGGNGEDYLWGGRDNDILIGGGDRDYLWGDGGNDYLLGGDSDDWLWGRQGDDTLNGGGNNDYLVGGNGDDLLDGGAGDDTVIGGRGADIFELSPSFGTDIIEDFQVGSDYLMLSGGLTFSDLSFSDNSISVSDTDEILATLTEVDTTTLTETDFVAV